MLDFQQIRELYSKYDQIGKIYNNPVKDVLISTCTVLLEEYYKYNRNIVQTNTTDQLAYEQANRIYYESFRDTIDYCVDGYAPLIARVNAFMYVITGNRY